MHRLCIVSVWVCHFHDTSFMQHLCIVGMCASNSNKSNPSRQAFFHISVVCCISRLDINTLCSLRFLLGSPSISKSSIESHSGSASVSWQNQTKQCFILRWQDFFHISVGCCISRLEIKKHFKSWPNQSKCKPASHKIRSSSPFQPRSSIRADCWLQRSKSFPSVDCLIQIFQNIPSLLWRLQNILWGSKGWRRRLCRAATCK